MFSSWHLLYPSEVACLKPSDLQSCSKKNSLPNHFVQAYVPLNSFKPKEERFRLDMRKVFFTVRLVRPWHREAMDAPPLEVFKARLVGTLTNLV